MKNIAQSTQYKWYILILAGLTNAVVVAIPSMGLSVLLPEISKDLDLSLVQVGIVWGIGSLPGIVTGLLAGAIGDRFGPKRILSLGCVLVGLAGAFRGISADYFSLSVMVFLFGFLVPLIIMNNIKTAGIWFPNRELGLANGVLSMGMALGFLVGSMLSATVLSPWLGGWQNVFFFYGAIAVVFSIPWFLTRPAPEILQSASDDTVTKSLWRSMFDLAHLKNLWLLSFAIMGISGSVQGVLGYLPLYLRELGWTAVSADGALAAFHMVSMLFVLPISLWSDRLGSRKKVLIGAALFMITGLVLLSSPSGMSVWSAVILAGLVRDGFMAIFLTMILEVKGVGPAYSGTATGFVMIFLGIGNLIAPPLGNSFATAAAGSPFLFWAGLTSLGLVCIALTTEPKPAQDSRQTVELAGGGQV